MGNKWRFETGNCQRDPEQRRSLLKRFVKKLFSNEEVRENHWSSFERKPASSSSYISTESSRLDSFLPESERWIWNSQECRQEEEEREANNEEQPIASVLGERGKAQDEFTQMYLDVTQRQDYVNWIV